MYAILTVLLKKMEFMTHIFGQLFQVTEEAESLAFCNKIYGYVIQKFKDYDGTKLVASHAL